MEQYAYIHGGYPERLDFILCSWVRKITDFAGLGLKNYQQNL
jgi:hypothetical protein